jgi:hypothetical protein
MMAADGDPRPDTAAYPADAVTSPAVTRLPHRQQVESMAGFGIPETDIARVLEIDADLLRDLYAKELESGHVKANARVAESLYRKAVGEGREAVTAAIFWLKTRAGWKETSAHEITGKDRQPLTIVLSAEDARLL